MAMIARRVHYSGRVQGVGFRATTRALARRFAVTGWVRNCPDGRVELWVEGAAAEVERFLAAVAGHWRGYVEETDVAVGEPTGNYAAFDVTH